MESGTLTQLRHLTRTTIVAETRLQPVALSSATGVYDLVIDGARVRCDVDTAQLDAVLGVLTGAGVLSLTASPPTLEELFLGHYGDQVPEIQADGDDANASTYGGRHGVARVSRGAK